MRGDTAIEATGSGVRSPVAKLSRRRALGLVTSGAVVALAGCLGDDSEAVPEPVALDEGRSCDQCSMQIDVHPGPVGQSYYLDDAPEALGDREDGFAHFCSAWCTYTYIFDHAESGPEPAGSYLTDYSTVDYTVSGEGGATVISAHLGADAFARAEDLTYAVGSDVEGAMGGSLIGFSDSGDTEAFVDEYGGTVVDHGDITSQTVANL
jgi:copper chaperone NosL